MAHSYSTALIITAVLGIALISAVIPKRSSLRFKGRELLQGNRIDESDLLCPSSCQNDGCVPSPLALQQAWMVFRQPDDPLYCEHTEQCEEGSCCIGEGRNSCVDLAEIRETGGYRYCECPSENRVPETEAPVPAPTLTPTTYPTPTPSPAIPTNTTTEEDPAHHVPTPEPVADPTPMPVNQSDQATSAPAVLTAFPSLMPSQPPTSSAPPTQKSCNVEVEIQCETPEGSDVCTIVSCYPSCVMCMERPEVIEFRFLGGDCSHTRHMQQQNTFTCNDYDALPANGVVYIIFAARDDPTAIYFEAYVEQGDVFKLMVPSGDLTGLASDMTVSIYHDMSRSTLLQEFALHTACCNREAPFIYYHGNLCSEPVMLHDRYGVLEIVGFKGETQEVTRLYDRIFKYIVKVEGANTVDIEISVNGESEYYPVDKLKQGEAVVITQQLTLDKTVSEAYKIHANAVAVTSSGAECSNSNTLMFDGQLRV